MNEYISFSFSPIIMEGATDPKFLEKRFFFRMGLLIYDNSKLMVALGLISCVLMSGLMTLVIWLFGW